MLSTLCFIRTVLVSLLDAKLSRLEDLVPGKTRGLRCFNFHLTETFSFLIGHRGKTSPTVNYNRKLHFEHWVKELYFQ